MLRAENAAATAGGADERVVTVARVLVVDGDRDARSTLEASLAGAGHEVETAASGEAGIASVRASHPDIVVFDLVLPDMPGVDFCRTLRAESGRRPSLCVLTMLGDESDRVAAFEAGVDDYVTKPYSARELVLRIRALSRRRASAPPEEAIVIGAMKIDRASRRVEVAGESVELTRREFDLLLHLSERIGRVQTRDALVTSVWREIADSGRVVDTTVKRLRRKLGPEGPAIRTVRGVGYTLVADEAGSDPEDS